ncbi:MAG: DNA polymerase III subunit beta [Longimicrobiales bacterium]|nr:DNA polymerase III subunit beta [Longimicrobiales bacterium]
MRFTVTRQNLHQGLAAVSASIPSKTTLPVLSNILLQTDDDGVWMSGTDLDVSIRVRIPADVAEAGTLTAPGKKLQEITRELADHPVQVSTRADQIELACGQARFKLNGLPAEEFPTLPVVDFGGGMQVAGSDLQRLIHHAAFAVSTEESRPILNGVLWEVREGIMRMVATNGHRLARMAIPSDAASETSISFIVPPGALQQVQRLFRDAEAIQVAWDAGSEGGVRRNHLGFRSDGVEVYTRLIEGTYPNYEQVIPKDNDKVAVVEKRPLEAAVRRMAVVASDQTHRIRMTLEADRMHLNVLTPDLGEGHDELALTYSGEPLEIGFNATYLLEVLRYMPSDEVRMTFKAPERAATIEPSVAEGEEALDYLCLVMPLRLLD